MIGFMARRTLLAVLSLFAISVITFFIIEMPWLTRGFAPDEPLYARYLGWMSALLQGRLGNTGSYDRPISDVLWERMLMTVILATATILFTWVMAIPIGIYSAVRQRSIEDHALRILGFAGQAVPDFTLALAMMYFAFVWFDFDIGGLHSREYGNAPWTLAKVWDLAKHLTIPVIVLGTSGTAGLIRIMRANLLDELPKPYVMTARARGMTELRLVLKYPVRMALNPLISSVGYVLPFMISGTVIVSVVLSLPTVGPVLLRALVNLDMYHAGTIILFLGLLTIVGTLLSDILQVLVDPRIRLESQ